MISGQFESERAAFYRRTPVPTLEVVFEDELTLYDLEKSTNYKPKEKLLLTPESQAFIDSFGKGESHAITKEAALRDADFISRRKGYSAISEADIRKFEGNLILEFEELLKEPRIYNAKFPTYMTVKIMPRINMATNGQIQTEADLIYWWDFTSPQSNIKRH